MKQNLENHFFASSAGSWMKTGPDRYLKSLLLAMDRYGLSYNLYFVPLPFDTEYEISGYVPRVDGAAWVGSFAPKSVSK